MNQRLLLRPQFRTSRVILALILREMSTTYGKSAFGYLWAILEPVLGIAIMTLVFGALIRKPPLGTSFALFYATGLVPFMSYIAVSAKVSQAVQFSKPLLVYPRVTYFDAAVARFMLTALTQLVVAYIIFSVLLMTSTSRMVLDFGAIGLSFAMALWLGFGIGVLNCLLFSVFPFWPHVWSVLNRPLFLISGIFFMYDSVPDSFKIYLWLNPLTHIVGLMRKGFYSSYSADYVSVAYVAVWAGITSVVGLFFLRRYHKKILNEL